MAIPNHAQQRDWSRLTADAWEAYKARFIFCGEPCGDNLGLVFDPAIGYQATSESSGYGMLIAVMMDDQETFDIIYDATYNLLLSPETNLFHWRIDNTATLTGFGSASDADIDIAAALIFAAQRVQNNNWNEHPDRPYSEAANTLIDEIYEQEVSDGRYLLPGNQYAGEGREIINLSYFAPAWLTLFDEYQNTARWQPVIDQGYVSLLATPGAEYGLAPDWSSAGGQPANDFCEEIGQAQDNCGFDVGYDAIRVPWRQAVHCLWNDSPRACAWSQRTVDFLNELPNPAIQARFFTMAGGPAVTYQDTVMQSMWLTAALAAGDQQLTNALAERLQWTPGTDETPGYWGTQAQSMDYYQQSLAWFAASLLSGEFSPVE